MGVDKRSLSSFCGSKKSRLAHVADSDSSSEDEKESRPKAVTLNNSIKHQKGKRFLPDPIVFRGLFTHMTKSSSLLTLELRGLRLRNDCWRSLANVSPSSRIR